MRVFLHNDGLDAGKSGDEVQQSGWENAPFRVAARFFSGRVKRLLGVALLLACLTTLIYSNTFSASFHFDDEQNIIQNSQIRHFSIFGQSMGSRYVGFFTLALNYQFGHLHVFGYHLVNLLIHIVNGFLVYVLVGLLLRTPRIRGSFSSPSSEQARWLALVTALVFVVHPIQTQAVTYIVQRLTILATMFYLLTVVCYVQWRMAESGHRARSLWYLVALGSAILAMQTKEISFTLPLMLVVVEVVCFRLSNWKQGVLLLPFLLTLPLIPLSLSGPLGQPEAGFARETTDISRLSYLFTQFRVVVTYLRLLIWPSHQNMDYDYPIHDSFLALPVVWSFLSVLVLLGGAGYLFWSRPKYRLVSFGLVWFFLTLSVESSIIPIRDVIFEHRLYLPSIGALLAGSVVVMGLLARLGMTAVIAVGGVLVVLSVATYQRNLVWKDDITLWTDVVTKSPKKARPHDILGVTFARQGRVDEAIREYMNAINLNANYPDAHNNLGNLYVRQGRLDEAIREFLTAIDLDPGFAYAHYELGSAYVQQGRREQATKEYMTAVHLKPDFSDAHNNLGNLYIQQGRLDEAITEIAMAIHLNPDFPNAHYNLGSIYAQQGRVNEAIGEFLIGLRLKSDLPEAHYNLGNLYSVQGRSDDAIKEYLNAIYLNPSYPEAHNNLGKVYAQQGRLVEAITEFLIGLRLRPDFLEAHYNLGSAYAQQGRIDEAIQEYITAIHLGADFPEVHYNIGHAYQLKGLKDEARRHFEIALRLRPGFTPAQQVLKSL